MNSIFWILFSLVSIQNPTPVAESSRLGCEEILRFFKATPPPATSAVAWSSDTLRSDSAFFETIRSRLLFGGWALRVDPATGIIAKYRIDQYLVLDSITFTFSHYAANLVEETAFDSSFAPIDTSAMVREPKPILLPLPPKSSTLFFREER